MNFSDQNIIFNPEKSNPVEQIKHKYECFRKKERIIADHLLSEPYKIVRMSVQEMAKLCACSESSIVRFCQMLGYSGFSQLKLELASHPESLANIRWLPEKTEAKGCPAEINTRRLLAGTASLLGNLIELLDYESIQHTVDAIISTQLLLVNGYLYSGQAGMVFTERMKGLGLPALLSWDHIGMKQNSRLACPGVVSLFISHSGTSQESIINSQLAKERGAKVIALTSYPDSPLALLADIKIIVPLQDKTMFEYYYPAELAFSMILTVIYETAAEKLKNTSNNQIYTKQFENELIKEAILEE